MKNNFQQNIGTEDIAELDLVRFGGKVVVVDDPAAVAAACEDLLSHPAIGFDTETRPSFKAGSMNKVALLQLSTPTTCYLFRLNCMALEKPILKVLESKKTLKIGADVPNDIRALQTLRHFKPGGFTDLQTVACQWGIAEKSVRKLSAIILRKRVSKAQRLSNWEANSLTDSQCSYAATDAWICLRMYDVLMQTQKNPLPVPEPAPPKEPKSDRKRYFRKSRKNRSQPDTNPDGK